MITKEESAVLNVLPAIMLFACAIPFAVIESPFFIAFLKAIRPAYKPPGREHLRGSLLDDVYAETLESTAAKLKAKPGKKTLGLDGKTNVRGRATVNVIEAKQGISAYVKTSYIGAQEHSGRVHADIAKGVLDDGKDWVAVVADNTGNMRVMFVLLRAQYAWIFFLGCVIHVLDLLIEGIAKLEEFATILSDFYFIVVFLKRHGLLYEAFTAEQKKRHQNKAFSLRLFPLTRFAYIYLLIYSCLRNWATLSTVSVFVFTTFQ
ncbi:hypothetical protein CYMTET_43862 [Cymbomonas tetramitiformis]|uniref:DUF659 domain-containing protein n=1 Tax=Cymbomonas tetramitiformis TaxID=36881 RepID=A0AAE0EZK0_9CHLO|nr:hypothetical protein CYMTET_43862 [Cymbomonas tetramitiformis]